jgi:hypothetical protein
MSIHFLDDPWPPEPAESSTEGLFDVGDHISFIKTGFGFMAAVDSEPSVLRVRLA